MKITDISLQVNNPDRVSVSVDGKYRFSLDISQVADLGVKIGNEYNETELAKLEVESQFGKLYTRALEYTFMRPRSEKEVRDYLWRKTLASKYKTRKGEIKERAGVPQSVTMRVLTRLVERGHVSDESFARWWIENRNQRKGASRRKLENELREKGVSSVIIDEVMANTDRSDIEEIKKVIAKKQQRYADPEKLKQYLMRQGFRYDDINEALGS